MSDLRATAQHFQPPDAMIRAVDAYGSGNINDTYKVSVDAGAVECFILQRINQQVFPRPEHIMANLSVFSKHVSTRLALESNPRRWEVVHALATQTGEDYWIDDHGDFWRALSFIDGARTFPRVQDSHHAREAGYALGRFHHLVSDLDPALLHDTLPGFHVIPHYLNKYDAALTARGIDRTSPEESFCAAYVAEHRHHGAVLERARDAGQIKVRTAHGDPKIDNIMIDEASGEAVSLIDLDTVKPGLMQHDVGDCLRSSCNPLGEETTEFEKVRFEIALCEVILRGYLPEVRDFFEPNDYAYLYDSVWVLAFEMGLRFFADHLAGNIYFKVRHPLHNLARAVVQFKLAESIAAQEAAIRTLVRTLS